MKNKLNIFAAVLLAIGLLYAYPTHAAGQAAAGSATATPPFTSPSEVVGQATAPTATPSQVVGQGTAPAATQNSPVALKISTGDLIDISVFDTPELNQEVRVGADGTAELALIGKTALAGLTSGEASEKIAGELRDRKFVLRPQVSVLIKEFATQGVSVTGEVQHPGVYPVMGPRTLLDVISMAGGVTTVADTRITIKRRGGAQNIVTARLKNDDPGAALANDVQVYPGDLVVVPRAGIVYVLGDVNRPGGFVMQDNGKISLLQALAQAGGTNNTASLNRAVLLRKTANGYVTEKLRVAKIARGKEPDVQMSANDVLFVPSSRFKSAVRDTGSIAASLGSASIYGVVR